MLRKLKRYAANKILTTTLIFALGGGFLEAWLISLVVEWSTKKLMDRK